MKSKEQTDQEIFEEATKHDNEISFIPIRHSKSQHPLDCLCDLCKPLRFKGVVDEDPKVEELDWDTT